MSRKKEPTHVTKKNFFPTRLRKLMEDQSITQKKLADVIEMRPQTVSLYTTGQSAPDVNTLRKMAEFFHVSSDYLIGLTDVQKPDTTIQAIYEYTGLSEKAVSLLHELHIGRQLSETDLFLDGEPMEPGDFIPPNHESLQILNYLLSNYRFIGVLCRFYDLGLCSASLRSPINLMTEDEMDILLKIPNGYRLISPFEDFYRLRYELIHYFERIVDHFTSEIRDYE